MSTETESSAQRQSSNGFSQLNVVFHGLWAFETQAGKIIAHTVVDREHKIMAGDFDPQYDLRQGETYTLTGVEAGDKNTFTEKHNVMVHCKPLRNTSQRFCQVDLPLPCDIKSVRRVIVPECQKPFEGQHGRDLSPEQVAMVQVFIYMAKDIEKVHLKPLPWEAKLDRDRTVNLHVYAQPDKKVKPGHAEQAYKRLAYMFGLDIVPAIELFVNVSNPCINGLDKEHLKGLMERSRPVMGASGSNCDSLVVNNVEP